MRFITVSLFFMGIVFYEMSGGADFVPPSQRDSVAASAVAVEDQPAMAANAAEPDAADLEGNAEDVTTRAAASPAVDGLSFATMTPQKLPVEAEVIQASAPAAPEAPRNVGEGSLKVLAVARPAAPEPAVSEEKVAAVAPRDIRQVTGSSVNMRNGPGTRYDVLGRLGEGDRVEVLQDPGKGWVKLKVEETGRVGWMADFLLAYAE